jgi:hypothetical protein
MTSSRTTTSIYIAAQIRVNLTRTNVTKFFVFFIKRLLLTPIGLERIYNFFLFGKLFIYSYNT